MKPWTSYIFFERWYCLNGRTVFFNCTFKEIRNFWNIFFKSQSWSIPSALHQRYVFAILWRKTVNKLWYKYHRSCSESIYHLDLYLLHDWRQADHSSLFFGRHDCGRKSLLNTGKRMVPCDVSLWLFYVTKWFMIANCVWLYLAI